MMSATIFVASLFLIAHITLVSAGCYSSHVDRPDPSSLKHGHKYSAAIASPTPTHDIATLPTNFDWCNRGDQPSMCTASWNQHIPQYCGTCWLHSSLSAVNDRIKIAKGGRGTDVILARQVLLNCGHYRGKFGSGCMGGDPYDVFEYMHRFGLPSETCQTYKAQSEECTDESICHNCMPVGDDIKSTKCWAVKDFTRYHVREYGRIHGEAAIMSEVFARGPVVCGMATTHDFDYNYTGGVYIDTTNAREVNHDVEIVGWGTTKAGVPYWNVRNSWGTYWGENGFFKLLRGRNNLRIEENCMYPIVDLSDEQREVAGEFVGSMYGRIAKPRAAQRDDHDTIRYGPVHENIKSLVDQQEEQDERDAAKAKKLAKQQKHADAGNNMNANAADMVLPSPSPAAASLTTSGMSTAVTVFVVAAIATLGLVVYRVAKRHHYDSLDI